MATSPAVAVSQFPGRNHDARRHKPLARLRTCGQSFGGPWTQYANPKESFHRKWLFRPLRLSYYERLLSSRTSTSDTCGLHMSCTNVPTLSILVTISAILNQVWQRRTQANCAHLEKLASAAASVLQTSNTVSSLVICSTSLNLLPKWQRSNDAPWVFALQCAATRMPSPALSI